MNMKIYAQMRIYFRKYRSRCGRCRHIGRYEENHQNCSGRNIFAAQGIVSGTKDFQVLKKYYCCYFKYEVNRYIYFSSC